MDTSKSQVRSERRLKTQGGKVGWKLPLAASAIVAALWAPAAADEKQDCLAEKDSNLRIKSCSYVIEQDPRDAITYHNRGLAYVSKGDLELGIADYTKAIELNPTYGDAYNSRGLAYASKGDYARAVADVTRASEVTPKKTSLSKAKANSSGPSATKEQKAVVAKAPAPKPVTKQVADDAPKLDWAPSWTVQY
jgi:tetratricopeptide (TPR) repeat protein